MASSAFRSPDAAAIRQAIAAAPSANSATLRYRPTVEPVSQPRMPTKALTPAAS